MKILTITTIIGTLLIGSPVNAGSTTATYYSDYFNGRKMANGRRFNQAAMTAAHPSLRLGTRIRVRHKKRAITVTVTDRCRCTLDLSKRAFRILAPLKKGRIKVSYGRI